MAGKNVTIGNVNISMSANAADLIRQVTTAEKTYKKRIKAMIKTTKGLSKSMLRATKNMTKFTKVMGLTGAGGAAVMGAYAYKVYEAQREMQRLSDIAGTSLEQFYQMSHVTQSLGLETEYLADGMKDLNVRIVDAAKGGGTMVEFFALMGESAKDWIDLAPEEQLDKFVEATSKLSDNEAKFWADEINDSMYRLSVTLRRSGKSVQDFMKEADDLGAGTSALLIDQVNKMYESFARLKIIFTEIQGTTFGILAESFGQAFDEMTDKLKSFTKEGETTGEGIFNLSKNMATYILTAINDIYVGVNTFITKTQLLLGKFDDSFTVGLLSQEQIKNLDKVNDQIDELQDKIEDRSTVSWFESMLGADATAAPEKIKEWEAELQGLIKVRDEILAGTANDGFTEQLNRLIENVQSQSYKLLKGQKGNEKGSPTKSNTTDGGEFKKSLEFLKQYQTESQAVEDAKIRQLRADLEILKVAEDHFKLKAEEGQLTQADIANSYAVFEAQKDLNAQLEVARAEANIKELQDKATLLQNLGIMELQSQKLNEEASKKQADLMLEQGLIDATEHEAALTEIKKNGEEERAKILAAARIEQLQHYQMQAAAMSGAADVAYNIMAGLAGEQSDLAKGMFLVSRAAAFGEAVVSAQLAHAKTLAAYPTMPWLAEVNRATAMASAGMILGTELAGQFHNGGQIPYDGTYYMEGGELVIPKDRVGEYIEAAGSSGGENIHIESNINMGANLVDERVMAKALAKQQSTIAALVQRENKKRPMRK